MQQPCRKQATHQTAALQAARAPQAQDRGPPALAGNGPPPHSQMVTGASTRCTFASSTSISTAFSQSCFTSLSLSGSQRFNCRPGGRRRFSRVATRAAPRASHVRGRGTNDKRAAMFPYLCTGNAIGEEGGCRQAQGRAGRGSGGGGWDHHCCQGNLRPRLALSTHLLNPPVQVHCICCREAVRTGRRGSSCPACSPRWLGGSPRLLRGWNRLTARPGCAGLLVNMVELTREKRGPVSVIQR